MRVILAHVMAALVVTSLAAAEPRGHHHDSDKGDGGSAAAADDSSSGAEGDEGADDTSEPAGAPVQPTGTPAQLALRQSTVDKRSNAIAAILKSGGGGPVTNAERQAIGMHWRHVMRLLRIRELAEADADKATITRVDALLERAATKFDAKLAHIHSETTGATGGAK